MLSPAYIDSGTGSLVLQFLIGSFLGLLFILKVFWRNLVGRVARLLGRKGGKAAGNPKTDPEDE